jgi:hypothetical protein
VEVARFLRGMYGKENVIMSDIIKPSKEVFSEGSYRWDLTFSQLLLLSC